MAVNLPYVQPIKDRRGGIAYCYYRRGKLRARIEDEDGRPLIPGQPGFLTAYDRIHARLGDFCNRAAHGPHGRRPGSVAALIAKFRESYEFTKNISAGSREQYNYHLRFLEDEFGDLRASKMSAEVVAELLNRFQETPRKANYIRTTISRLWNYGRPFKEFGIDSNPTEGVAKLKQGKGWRPWTEAELTTFMAKAPMMMRVAAALAVYTGQRRGDIARMLWSQFDGTAIEVVQEKTGTRVWIPAHSQLRAVLAKHPRQAATILVTSTGKAFIPPYLGKSFAKAIEEAGLPSDSEGCHLHGLRKTAGVELAHAGCTAHEIMAILGCSMQNAEYYCKQASQRKLAISAMAKMDAR